MATDNASVRPYLDIGVFTSVLGLIFLVGSLIGSLSYPSSLALGEFVAGVGVLFLIVGIALMVVTGPPEPKLQPLAPNPQFWQSLGYPTTSPMSSPTPAPPPPPPASTSGQVVVNIPAQPAPIIMIQCRHCGSLFEVTSGKCNRCGAPLAPIAQS